MPSSSCNGRPATGRYYATLGKTHQDRWTEWVADGVAKYGSDNSGRQPFSAALAAFVR